MSKILSTALLVGLLAGTQGIPSAHAAFSMATGEGIHAVALPGALHTSGALFVPRSAMTVGAMNSQIVLHGTMAPHALLNGSLVNQVAPHVLIATPHASIGTAVSGIRTLIPVAHWGDGDVANRIQFALAPGHEFRWGSNVDPRLLVW